MSIVVIGVSHRTGSLPLLERLAIPPDVQGKAIAGLVAMTFFGAGRLVLVALLGSLLPYIFTWNVGGERIFDWLDQHIPA